MELLNQKLVAVQNEVIRILREAGEEPIIDSGVTSYSGREWRHISLKEPVSGTRFSINFKEMDRYSSMRGAYRISTCRDGKAHTRTTSDGKVNAEKLLALISDARNDCLREHYRANASRKAYEESIEIRNAIGMESSNSLRVSGLYVDIGVGRFSGVEIKISGSVNAEKAAAIIEALRNIEVAA